MKITFLGTAAAEGIPFPFCNCTTCKHARTHKGRNIRKRQTPLINDDLLIDIGPDLFSSCAHLGISLAGLRYLLVTHSHGDHFHALNLELRAKMFRLETELPELTMAPGPSVWTTWGTGDKPAELRRMPLLAGQQAELSPYSVRAIEASHMPSIGDAMNFIIDDGRTKLLFASDTGKYKEQVWEQLAGTRFDAVIMEATLGNRQQGRGHLSFDDFQFMLEQMSLIGAVTPRTRIFATHFSHQCVDPHEEIEAYFQQAGVVCAYDGLIIEL
ncbi:MBL fold metallo-hydrolase [Paenibacillus sp. P26]|nr:MBL fold metallo-hydrolase [Paenibacillus sp. P26]